MREERKERGEEGRGEGRKERGRKEGEGKGGKGREEERETKENITLLCCKNGQLTYHISNLILLPSNSILLNLKPISGEVEGGREGQRLKSVVAMNQGGLKIGSPQTFL